MNSQEEKQISFKEQRVRKASIVYYSRPDIQKAIAEFSKDRECIPRYFEGFGKRPDAIQYPSEVFELAKKGATSFHCSEELWNNPLDISTGMSEQQANQLRKGWDLLIDIDTKWFDYSKLAANAVIKVLNNHGVKNIGVKFSGSKGWHILVPWKAFPKEIGGELTKNMFPELPRKIVSYIRFKAEEELKNSLTEDFYRQIKSANIKRGIKCNSCKNIAESYSFITLSCRICRIGEQKKLPSSLKEKTTNFICPSCRNEFEVINIEEIYECKNCMIDSKTNPSAFSKTVEVDLFELLGLDIVLVSSRHLFRTPYSLHEKTALASVVINPSDINKFELKDADPFKAEIKEFNPAAKESEARELVIQALDWAKSNLSDEDKKSSFSYSGGYSGKQIKIEKINEENFPPCIKKILCGLTDGKKRALFALLNLLNFMGVDKPEIEKIIWEWNEKNNPKLRAGYIKSQLSWSFKSGKSPIMPPNCKEFYQGIGVCIPDSLCSKVKNPINYVIKKTLVKKPVRKSRK